MTQKAFSAFPKNGLQFLRSLKRNNNREWFQHNQRIYHEAVKQPMTDLVSALAEDFSAFAPEMVSSPKTSLYRIHRDTRFSKDKSPYKTHIAAVFPRSGLGKHEGAGFYLHISPSELLIAGGLYMPFPADLNVVRQHIADNTQAFLKVIRNRQFRRLFGTVGGERLSRVPRGFPAEHPAADYLKCKQFLVDRTFSAAVATTPQFYRLVVDTFRAMTPFVRFLNEPIVKSRKVRERQDALMRDDIRRLRA